LPWDFGIELIYAAADAVQIDQLLSSEPLDRSRWILLKRTSVVYFTIIEPMEAD
jgi:hypothetical protein